mmetsp:Transcript_36205/g.102348  ORF Transcript_36205/g.102348 Transcript_36205/m.102348 type:complete len:254 (+) Transcript_36205:347-1108(+)|eukprot:CAMPEP_0117660476 /NCGR_PEP_ID=MMETSP0804-20121206/6989_1 /TAXON_ID=1074897 /ORGANISM="Tetraselmis astigmatica, Strain CCMP880" /LENGTH=253 /DNA_ID=CAMNT_0005467209 /DNA_START=91 /DNA_END=852 /DNA_ORIENTATION=-
MLGSWFSTAAPEMKCVPLSRVYAHADARGCWTVELLAAAPREPKMVYDMLTMPNNAHIYRNIEAETCRNVLSTDGPRQTIEVVHESSWRFWFFDGRIRTRQLVKQDDAERSMSFVMEEGAIVKHCGGAWRIWNTADCPPEDVMSEDMEKQHSGLVEEVKAATGEMGGWEDWAIAHMTYSVLVGLPVPSSIVKSIVVQTAEHIWEDLATAVNGNTKAAAADSTEAANLPLASEAEDVTVDAIKSALAVASSQCC